MTRWPIPYGTARLDHGGRDLPFCLASSAFCGWPTAARVLAERIVSQGQRSLCKRIPRQFGFERQLGKILDALRQQFLLCAKPAVILAAGVTRQVDLCEPQAEELEQDLIVGRQVREPGHQRALRLYGLLKEA